MAGKDVKQLIKQVLEKGYLMSLGTVDDGGVWVSDVIYVFDGDFTLYWMSKLHRRHSRAIEKSPQVAGTITAYTKIGYELGIQFEGVAQKIEGVRFDLAKKHCAKRGKPEPKETDDVLDGGAWYMAKPKKIELICQEHFGYEKQKLEF